jgi:ketol-acid reductoisomerase
MGQFSFDKDADLDRLRDRRVAILGYGNQGRSQGLNLKDSGIPVLIGNNAEAARADAARADAAAGADFKLILTSDDSHPEVYRKWIEPSLKPHDVLSFAHGFNIHFGEIKPFQGCRWLQVLNPQARRGSFHRLEDDDGGHKDLDINQKNGCRTYTPH